MTKYLTSSDQVTQLCERFGYTLEHLTIADQQLLRFILVTYMTINSAYKPLSLTESMLETENMIHQITDKYPSVTGSVFIAIGILEGIRIDTAEGLIESITKLIKSEAIASANFNAPLSPILEPRLFDHRNAQSTQPKSPQHSPLRGCFGCACA